MEKIRNIKHSRYDLNGNLYFEDEAGHSYIMNAKTALEIAYALFDSLNMPYTTLEYIEAKIK